MPPRQMCEFASSTSDRTADSREVSWAGTPFPLPKREFPFRTCQMWAGHGGSCTPCHYDSLCNFLSQVVAAAAPTPERHGAYVGRVCM